MPVNQDSWVWKFRQRWSTDVFDATMALRLQEWELVDDAALAQTAAWAREATETHEEEFSFVLLDGLMSLLARTWGDPPVGPDLVATARRYLSLPLDDELADAAEPLIRQLVPDLDAVLENVRAQFGENAPGQLRRVLGGIALRLALPRVELLRLTGRLMRVADGQTDPFGIAFQAGIDCARTDPGRSESHLRQALDLATVGHPPADRLVVIRTLLHRPGGGLQPATLRACAEHLRQLADAGLNGDQVAGEIGRAAMQANAAQLAPELYPVLAEAAETVLAGEVSVGGRIVHSLEAAQWWLRVGRLDRCDLVLVRLRDQAGSSAAATLGIARIETELRRRCADTSSARPMLAAALAATEGQPVPAVDRARAIIELISCWPVGPGPADGQFRPLARSVGKHELPGWCAEAERCVGGLSPRAQNDLRVSLLFALFGIGAGEQAEELSARVDLSAFASQSADYSQWSAEFVAWARRRLADEQGVGPPAGDYGKTYADLAEEERFPEAAEAAAAQAAVQESRGFRVDAYHTLLWSAQLHILAGDWAAALKAYEHAFSLLEQDLLYLPYVELVTRRLAAWPNLYQQAAVLALRLGNPVRAVSLAETGRARATSSRLGRAGPARPSGVAEADEARWRRFTQLWRRAVAEAASELVTVTAGALPGADTTELNELRRAFLDSGVAPEDLAPVAPPVDVSGLPSRLAAAARPTAVLYPIQVRHPADHDLDTIRFVRISASGVTEIPVAQPRVRTEIVHIIEKFGADVRAAPPSLLGDLLANLVGELGPRLKPVLSQAVTGVEDGRLIWIPQGPAAGVPIAALPCRDGQLINLVSVITAPSLRVVADAAAQDAAQPLRGVVVEGPAGPGQALTDGGDRLLGDGNPVARPASLNEVSPAVTASTLVYLSCHGHFRWDRPLSSSLQLGADPQHLFELPVADIFDAVELPADALVLLGACDSGTVAQTDLNEGVGLPAAFLAAGSRAVIGAGWPVIRGVAVGICLKFLQALRDGQASPEALRLAALWIRGATIADLDTELAAIGHPLYRGKPATEAQAALRRRRAFAEPSLWASYVHWGGGWRAAPAPGVPAR